MAWSKTTPATTTKVKDSPAILQANWAAIEDAFEQEHQDTSDALPGAHLPGRCGVMYVGSTANIAALTTPPACAVAYNTSLSAFQYYTGSAWTTCSADHGELTGLTDDDHTQYLKLTKTGQTITEDITLQGSVTMTASETVDGIDISAHAAGDAKTQHTDGLGTLIGTIAAKSATTIYQAATDGILVVIPQRSAEGTLSCLVYSDSGAAPSTIVGYFVDSGSSLATTITAPIKKNDYYQVVVTGQSSITITFYPIGS